MTGHLESSTARRVEILGPVSDSQRTILTPEALAFVSELSVTFAERIDRLLAARDRRQRRIDLAEQMGFPLETEHIRNGDWTVAPIPHDLVDRRVEITGPVDRKVIINALNSSAQVFMADFEDSTSPTWDNVVDGQVHLRDAVRGTIRFDDAERGRVYTLGERRATLMVRPRGLHLLERHVLVDDRAVPASLFDFGLFFFHNVKPLLATGTGPYFYLSKLESHLEARLWNDVFVHAQRRLGIPVGTVRATVLIQTLPAAFEMDEILYELREHSAGLNCGRWDYIFSFTKTLAADPSAVLPDRSQVGMDQRFLRSTTELLVKTCHRRDAHAMGGMAAQIPINHDPERNARAMEKVRADKLREVLSGHDGTWVAHPGLIEIAREVFDEHMPTPHQIHVKREDVEVEPRDLLAVPRGRRTEAGLRRSVNVSVRYLEGWLRGSGCVPLYDLMEDTATAEISRMQIWQWITHGAPLEDGRIVSVELFRRILAEEIAEIVESLSPLDLLVSRLEDAAALFDELVTSDDLTSFLTVPAYERYLLTVAYPPD